MNTIINGSSDLTCRVRGLFFVPQTACAIGFTNAMIIYN
jgi:hypothetical protein